MKTATLGGQITNNGHPEPTLLRLQTSAISEHKADKTRHFVLEGVGVPELGQPPSGIPGRSPYEKYGSQMSDADLKLAQENHCDYVLFSLVSPPSATLGAIPHTSLPTPNQGLGAPYGGADTQGPEIQMQVTYRLHQITPGAPPVEGTVSAHDTGSGYSIASKVLAMVANQVFEKIAKSAPPSIIP